MRGKPQNRTPATSDRGFALIIVLWIVALTSLIALTLAASVRSEIQVAISEQDRLVAELLAESGLAFADYLETRNLGTTVEDLTDLPIAALVPGFHYRADLPEGQIELYFEGEDGKINLSTARRELIQNFFTLWTGDPGRGAEIGAAIDDWRDIDDQQSLLGAEGLAYSDQGYLPRNGALGMSDPILLRGLTRQDFMDRVVDADSGLAIRPGLNAFVTTDPAGPGINPNLAPLMVLSSIPGISAEGAEAIMRIRPVSRWTTLAQLDELPGVVAGIAAPYLSFTQPVAPAVLSLGRSTNGARQSIRLIRQYSLGPDPITFAMVNRLVDRRIERNVFPSSVAP